MSGWNGTGEIPRLGFLGVGWIGCNRLEAVARSGKAKIAAIADTRTEPLEKARALAPEAVICSDLDSLLEQKPDGVVIATPSAFHAEQSIAALRGGMAVFCQKPLGRNTAETKKIIMEARLSNRLLGVDLSYRYLEATSKMHERVMTGEIGNVFAANLAFHNAYGPDKSWYYRPAESGGGCVCDLGVHLVDLALWMLGFPVVQSCESRLFSGGKPLNGRQDLIEDYAVARLDLESGAVAEIECSWNIHAGCDANIEAVFFGEKGGVELRNVNGSFYDFSAELYRGTNRETLSLPPDEWGGRAILRWVDQLGDGGQYNQEIETMIQVAAVLDSIYGRPVDVET